MHALGMLLIMQDSGIHIDRIVHFGEYMYLYLCSNQKL